jgi:hypothetical protein
VSVPGIDVPDSRGRTGLDQEGRDLTGNPDVVVRDVELLASGWHVLRRTTLERRHPDGSWTTEQRETYDRGGVAEEGEDIEIVELDFDEALDMIDDGRIADAKTIMLLQWAALRGPFRS